MMKILADKCPHCGGRSGFYTNMISSCNRSYQWNGNEIDTDNFRITSESKPKCSDCGEPLNKVVKVKAVTSWNDEIQS